MGDDLYIEPAGNDDYEEDDYSSSYADHDRRYQHGYQGRKQSIDTLNSNETIGHSTNPVSVIDATNEPYIHLNGLLHNFTKNEGEELKLKCSVSGILPIEFRWYKNDAPLQKEKNRVLVRNRDYWSRLRITQLEPMDRAFYRCEASNKAGIVKTTSLVHVNAGKHRSNIGAPNASPVNRVDEQSLDSDDESAFFKPFTCQEYTFEACHDYLYGQRIYIHSKNVEDIRDIDRTLRAAFLVISNSSQVSDKCKQYAARAACYHSYQVCDNGQSINDHNRNGAFGSTSNAEPPIRRICRYDCQRLEEEICPQEYETARSQNLIGKGKDQILPNCRDLPNIEKNCLRILEDINESSSDSSSCYVGNGNSFDGTVSTTKTGRRCQSWAEATKKHPLFSPSKYPELKNNYCRNPGGRKPQPWCFAVDGVEEYCAIPKCGNVPDHSADGIDIGIMTIPSGYMRYGIFGAGILGVLLLAIFIGALCYCVKSKRKRAGKPKKMNGILQPVGAAQSAPSLAANQAFMNGHQGHYYHQNRHHHYGSGLIGNGIRKGIANGQQMELYSLLSPSTNTGMSPQAPALMDVPREIPASNIHYLEVMGEGQFGKVWKGELIGYATATTTSSSDDGAAELGNTRIAVKALRDDANIRQRQDFEHEVTIKAKLKHENILELIGVSCMRTSSCLAQSVTNHSHPSSPCMIFEFMMHGDLNEFLQLRSPRLQTEIVDDQRLLLDQKDFLHIATQIASGMEYLASQNYVHKDLATRNCFIGHRLTAKISDFGQFRDIYASDYYHHQWKNGLSVMLPLRWMSPEAFVDGRYSEFSDVWAFGMTLFEIFSYGQKPYYEHSNVELLDMLSRRRFLKFPRCPENCPRIVYDLMLQCWQDSISRRPRFDILRDRLESWSIAHQLSQNVISDASTPTTYCPPPSSIHGGNGTSISPRSSRSNSTSMNCSSINTRPIPVGSV